MDKITLLTLVFTVFCTFTSARVRNRIYTRLDGFKHDEKILPKATPTPECVDTITCGEAEFVAKCVTCRPEYFHCTTPGGPPIESQCRSGLVFNPDPAYPKCVLPSNCPYHPPWTLPSTAGPSTTAAATTAAVTTGAATTGAVTTGAASTGAVTTGAVTTGAATTGTGTTGAATTGTGTTGAATTGTGTTGAATTGTGTTGAATTGTGTTGAATTGTGTTGAATTGAVTTGAVTTGAATTGAVTTGAATTAAATTAATTEATTSGECTDSLTCPSSGFYARCITCQTTYFQCDSAGQPGSIRECTGGKVFNPDPIFPKCILPSTCPYHG